MKELKPCTIVLFYRMILPKKPPTLFYQALVVSLFANPFDRLQIDIFANLEPMR